MSSTFDARQELAAFYLRHFDELVDACLDVSSHQHRWSPLNTLPLEERRSWVAAGFKAVMLEMLGEEIDYRGRVYYPRVSELGDAPLFGMADVIDSCECALLPDEGILPLLWADYRHDPDLLYALVVEFRQAQNSMTKANMRQKMDDLEEYIAFVKAETAAAQRAELESAIYRRFYLALKSLRDKTSDLYERIGESPGPEKLRTEVTQLKMMEADLLSEVFRIDPDVDAGHRERRGSHVPGKGRFAEACTRRGLTERERAIAELVAQGYTNAQISLRLSLAGSTVKNHLSGILAKLGKENRAQIVAFAAQNGFFDEG